MNRHALLLAPLLALLACREPDTPTLRGRPLGEVPENGDAVLAGNEFHEYDLGELADGDAVHVVLEQRGVDLVAQVVGDDGAVVLHVDGPFAAHGFEHVCFAARAPGTYRLRVGPFSADDAGPYAVRLRERTAPPTGERIRHCEAALGVFAEASARHAEASAEVVVLYERAVELWRRSGEPFPLAVALREAGSLSARRGELDDALRFYAEALGLLRQLGREGDPRQLAAVLNFVGLARNRVGDPEGARASFEEARTVSQGVEDRYGEAVAISNLALWETEGGDLYRAVELHREALDVWRDLGLKTEEATTLNVLGFALTRLGLYEQALDVLGEALAIRRHDAPPELLANTWVTIGWAEHLSGRGEQAVERFLRAAELYREAGAPLDEAGALDRLGSAYRGLGRHDDARDAFERGLAVYRASADRVHTAHTASNLGCLLGDAALLDEAGETFAALGDRAALRSSWSVNGPSSAG